MPTKSRLFIVLFVLLALALVTSTALTVAIFDGDPGVVTGTPNGIDIFGLVTFDSADVKNVCATITGTNTSPLVVDCTEPSQINVQGEYRCNVPDSELGASLIAYQIYATTANGTCTGGSQQAGPSGTYDPSAIELVSMTAADGGFLSTAALFAAAALLGLGALFVHHLSQKS